MVFLFPPSWESLLPCLCSPRRVELGISHPTRIDDFFTHQIQVGESSPFLFRRPLQQPMSWKLTYFFHQFHLITMPKKSDHIQKRQKNDINCKKFTSRKRTKKNANTTKKQRNDKMIANFFAQFFLNITKRFSSILSTFQESCEKIRLKK